MFSIAGNLLIVVIMMLLLSKAPRPPSASEGLHLPERSQRRLPPLAIAQQSGF